LTDNGNPINVIVETAPINAVVMGEGLKSSQRILLNGISLKYVSDTDLSVILYYRRDPLKSQALYGFSVPAGSGLWRQKLPPHLAVSEFSVEVRSSVTGEFRIEGIGVIYDVINVGFVKP